MATTVGQHSVASFTSPVNGTTPIDANTVRGNDNTIRVAYVDHDADPGIHVQSSTLASRPTAGTAGRKWITEDSGVYTLWFDDGTNWHPVSSENVALTVLAGENLVKGDVVKVTGWNNGQDLPEVSKVASASDVAFAVMTAAVSSGSMGYATNTGIVQDVNTNSFAVGTILYPNTSGGFTSTKPTSGNYQTVAFVLRQNTNNGVIFVEFSSPRIVERSDNTASTVVLRDASGNFSAGTITAGAVTSTGLVTFASLKGTGATTVTNILDEDNMASDSATALATQQSIKAYVDAQVATVDTLAEVLANGNTTGANNIIVTAGQKVTTDTIDETTAAAGVTIDSVLLKDDVVNATDIEVDTISANNGTLAVTLGSTGVATIAQQPILSSLTASQAVFTDASKGLVSNAITGTGNVVMSASPTLTGTVTAATINATTLGGTLSTAAQPNVTSVGTLTSLTVSGNVTVDTNTLFVDSSNDRVGIGTTTPGYKLQVNQAIDTYAFCVRDTLGNDRLLVGSRSSAPIDNITPVQIANDNTGNLLLSSRTNNASGIKFYSNAGTAAVERMALDSAGNLAVDTNTLYVDAANNRVGVGTATPNSSYSALQVKTVSSGYSLDLIGNAGNDGQISFWNAAQSTNHAYLSTSSGNSRFDIVAGASYALAFGAGNTANQMRLDTSGNLGLGVTPSAWSNNRAIEVGAVGNAIFGFGASNVNFTSGAYYNSGWKYAVSGAPVTYYNQSSGLHQWYTAASGTAGNAISFTQAMTLDASGNLGVGTTSPISFTGYKTIDINSSTGGLLALTSNGTNKFQMYVNGSSTTLATVVSEPLVFQTNSTERARITSGGYFKASDNAEYIGATSSYHEFNNTADSPALVGRTRNASMTSSSMIARSTRSANSAFSLFECDSGDGADREFQLRGDGNGYADGTWNNNGADYAEYFESATGEALTVGATVVLDGNKVREATSSDPTSAVMGVVRPKAPGKASMVVGNTAWNKWSNKYLTDDFDCYVMEDHDVVEWTDAEGKFHSYESHNIPAGIEVPEDAVVKTHDDAGNKFQHYKLNPDYDPSVEYVPREKRDEWVIIGLVGQVKVLKGQPVNDRWVKMRDVSASVEEWMIR